VKVKEKYFKTKYRPLGILLKCLSYDDKNYSYIIVNFHTGLH